MRISISTKLLAINLMIFIVFGVIIGVMAFSFANIRSMTGKIIRKDVERMVRNARHGRDFFKVVSETGLLVSMFYGNDQILEKQSDRLMRLTDLLTRVDADAPLKASLAEFRTSLAPLLNQCALINRKLSRLKFIFNELNGHLTALEALVAEQLLDMAVRGEDITPKQQLSALIPTYRETLFQAALQMAHIEPTRSHTRDVASVISLLDELRLRLQTMLASDPEVARHVDMLLDGVFDYKETAIDFNDAILEFAQHRLMMEKARDKVAAEIARSDKSVIAAVHDMQQRIGLLMKSSIRFVYALSGLVILVFGAYTYIFIYLNIRKPMGMICDQIAPVGEGDLIARVKLHRKDEWSIIENALNKMASDVHASHSELSGKNKELLKTHEILEREIAERVRAEELLQQERDLMKLIMETSPVCITVLDRDGRIIFANSRAEELYRLTRDQIGRLTYNAPEWRITALDGSPFPEEELPFNQVRRSGRPVYDVRHAIERSDGARLLLSINAAPLPDAEGRFNGMAAVVSDITAKQAAQAEKEKLQKQLLHAQKMEAVGTLAGGVAHDFNNLLQGIQGYAELLLLNIGPDHPEYRKLQAISQAAVRGGELVKRLLTFARKVDGKQQILHLNSEVRTVKKLLERTIPRMIRISLDLREDLKTVRADPIQIEQVLMNLSVNAKDAMPGGGDLRIETRNEILDASYCRTHAEVKPGAYVSLSVSDTGHGMEKEVLDKIFTPFFTTKEMGKGTGLGLAMVFGIVKDHGGHITCYSEPGKGTLVKILLPAAGETADATEETPPPLSEGGNETIMIVDDEPYILDMAEQILEQFGYRVLMADDGNSAAELYRRNADEIDLVILDLNMPGLGGWDCLRRLLDINPDVKVVIASGFSANGALRNEMAPRVAGFINKPYHLRELVEIVRKILDNAAGGPGPNKTLLNPDVS